MSIKSFLFPKSELDYFRQRDNERLGGGSGIYPQEYATVRVRYPTPPHHPPQLPPRPDIQKDLESWNKPQTTSSSIDQKDQIKHSPSSCAEVAADGIEYKIPKHRLRKRLRRCWMIFWSPG